MGIRKWIERLTRAESLWSLWNLAWPYIATLGGAAVIGYLSQGAEFVSQFGLFGYAVVGLVAFLLISVGFAIIAWGRNKWRGVGSADDFVASSATPTNKQGLEHLETVYGGYYSKETVRLDGYRFVKCEFHECTLEFDGGFSAMDECGIVNGFTISSNSEEIRRTISLFFPLFVGPTKSHTDKTGRTRMYGAVDFNWVTRDSLTDTPQLPGKPEEKPQ